MGSAKVKNLKGWREGDGKTRKMSRQFTTCRGNPPPNKKKTSYAALTGASFFCPEIRAFTGFGARFLQPFPESLVTVLLKYYANTKWPLMQTPSSVSFLALTQFWGESSVSSSQPIICVCDKANSPRFSLSSPSLSQNSVSSLLRNSTFETVFCPFV